MARRAIIAKPRKTVKKTVRVGKGLALAASGNTLVKDLRPKDPDVMHYGPEPSFSGEQPNADNRQSILTNAWNWYSRFYGCKEAKEFLIAYLEGTKADKDTIKIVRKAPDKFMITTAGWVARAATRGLVLEPRQIEYLNAAIAKLTLAVNNGVKTDEELEAEENAPKPASKKPSIQEIMREKADEAASDIEALYDEYVTAKYPRDFAIDKKVVGAFQSRNVLPQHIAPVIKRWQRLLDEFLEVQDGKDAQLNEGYANLSKMQIRYAIKFIEQVIAELNGYISLKQATKKVRARKAIPVETTVAKLKYLKAFKDAAQGLDLTSLSPVKLHQCTEAWVYDTAKRKMYHFVADSINKCLTVKGNTILGFDKKQSEMKTLRKPAEQIKSLMGSKPAARKFFTDIKAVGACPTGRFNADMVILKAF